MKTMNFACSNYYVQNFILFGFLLRFYTLLVFYGTSFVFVLHKTPISRNKYNMYNRNNIIRFKKKKLNRYNVDKSTNHGNFHKLKHISWLTNKIKSTKKLALYNSHKLNKYIRIQKKD